MRKISIGTAAFTLTPGERKEVGFAEVLMRVRSLGFQGIELAAFGGHPNPISHPTERSRYELRESLAQSGIGISGVCPNFWSLRLVGDDSRAYLEAFKNNLSFAAEIGSPMIRVDTIHPPEMLDGVSKEVARQRIVRVWKRAILEAGERGLDVVWEFEPGFIFNRPSDIVEMVEAFDDPNFGVLFDICHAHMIAVVGARQTGGPEERLEGGVVELARQLRGRIRAVHVGDSDGTLYEGGTSKHVPIGQGCIDFPPVLEELARYGGIKEHWWTIDLCNWTDVWGGAQISKVALDRLVGAVTVE